MARGNMISILIDSAYGGGPGGAALSGATEPKAIQARRLSCVFITEFCPPLVQAAHSIITLRISVGAGSGWL
jgi:hypothetical protein